jgi:hypothetical protein
MLSGTRVSYKCKGVPLPTVAFFLYIIHWCSAADWNVLNSIFSYFLGCTSVTCACCFISVILQENFHFVPFILQLIFCLFNVSFMRHTFRLFYISILRSQLELWQYSSSVVWWLNLCVIILGSVLFFSLKSHVMWSFLLKIRMLWSNMVEAYSLWCCWLKTCDSTFLSSSVHSTCSMKSCNWFQVSTAKEMRTAAFWAITTTRCIITQNNAVLR